MLSRTMLAVAVLIAPVWAGAAEINLLPEPCRMLDTRGGALPLGPAFFDGEIRIFTIQAAHRCPATAPSPIPAGADGLLLSVTVLNATGSGFLTFYDPTSTVPPVATSVSLGVGVVRTSSVTTALGPFPAPDMAVFARVSGGGTVDVLIDIVGYYAPGE